MTIKFPTANEIRNSMPTKEELLRREQEEIENMMRFSIVPTIESCAKQNQRFVVFQGNINQCVPLLRTLGYTVKYINNFTEVHW